MCSFLFEKNKKMNFLKLPHKKRNMKKRSNLRDNISQAIPYSLKYFIRKYKNPWGREVNLKVLEHIKNSSIEQLKNQDYLENNLLPKLGLNNEALNEIPDEFSNIIDKGLLFWQYPNQFSKYLLLLSTFKISNYIEIGVRHGGTFILTLEYLKAIGNKLKWATAVDIRYSPSIIKYRKTESYNINLLLMDSDSLEFKSYINKIKEIDLVFIDGDHSFAYCLKDFEKVKDISKIIVFHDIVNSACPGVPLVWQHVKTNYSNDYDFYEFIDQYDSVLNKNNGNKYLGMGVAIKK